jgi:Copper transport outer membrane protein, MctB
MISLRQHAISLAAVFLALAIGVVLGSGLLSDTILSGLRDEKKDLQGTISELTEKNNALNEKLSAANSFDAQMSARIVRDALAGKSVVVIRTPDAADDDIDAAARILGQAGASITGTVALTQEFVEAHSAEKLRSVVNSSILPAGTQLRTALVDQGSQAGDLLGIALLVNREPDTPSVDESQRQTVLAALRDTGFITYGPDRFEAANAALIITGGALGADAGNQGATVARFAAAMAPRGSGSVLAGRDGSASGSAALTVVRSDTGMASAVTTVDDIGTESGRITAALALQDTIRGAASGQYGIGKGATAVTIAQ